MSHVSSGILPEEKEKKEEKKDKQEKGVKRKVMKLAKDVSHSVSSFSRENHIPKEKNRIEKKPIISSPLDLKAMRESSLLQANLIHHNGSSLLGFESKNFFVCERSRAKNWVNSELNLEIISENEVLTGFKLYVVEEWIFDPKLYWVLIESTGNSEDKILVAVCQLKSNVSPTNRKYLESTFFKPTSEGIKAKEVCSYQTFVGTLLVADLQFFSNYSLIYIPDGDYDKHFPTLIHQITLKRLNCSKQPLGSELLSVMEEKFYSMYHISPTIPISKAIETLVADLQLNLKSLGYLPLSAPLDSIYSNPTLEALKKFQNDWNNQNDEFLLPNDGYLTPETLECLNDSLKSWRQKLENLGFQSSDDQSLSKLITSFQISFGLMVDGMLNKATKEEIERQIKEQEIGLEEERTLLMEQSSTDFFDVEKSVVDPNMDETADMEKELMKRLSYLRNTNQHSSMASSKNTKNYIDNSDFFEKTYVSCERESCKIWAKTENFEIVFECEQLSGYKIYAVEDWYNSNPFFIQSNEGYLKQHLQIGEYLSSFQLTIQMIKF